MLSAVIFDFDGVIVDSEPLHFQAFLDVLKPEGMGFTWNEYVETYIGFDDRDAFRECFKVHEQQLTAEKLSELIEKKAVRFEELVHEGNAHPFAGSVELIRDVAGKKPLALCSGALRSDILPILKQLDLEGVFDVMVTADDVHVSKPDPASYKLAYENLQEKFGDAIGAPETCIAIEDTGAGIRSAKGAGMKVLAVTHSYESHELSHADWIVDSFEPIDLKHFHKVMT
ncbi:HAD family hydrolase [Verrucomicrobiota bacterium]